MKKTTVIRLGFLAGAILGCSVQGQVFNVHDIRHGYAFYGGYNIMAFGQGACADPGNNIWNGFGNGDPPGATDSFGSGRPNDVLLPGNPGNPYAWSHPPFFASGPNLFSPTAEAAAGAGNASSAGVHTPVTMPRMVYGVDSGTAVNTANPTMSRTNVAAFIFSEAAVVNGASAGVGTAANPMGLLTLSNVPSGTYDLYLYSANFDGTRGASFIVSSGTPSNGVYVAMNPNAAGGSGPLTNFMLGTNYVVYNNVTPAGDSTITVTWGAISNVNSTLEGEGDFNGLQLAASVSVAAAPTLIQQPVDANYSQGTTATLSTDIRGNPAVSYQWYKGNMPGTVVVGQTGAALSFVNAQASQSGSYYVVGSNTSGSVTSSVVTLTIAAAPLILGQSSTNSLQLYSGHNHFAMSVNAVGAAPLYYFWRANGTTVATTTNSGSMAFSNTTITASYSCLVSNSFGTAANQPLSVTIVPAPATPYAGAILSLNPLAYWPLDETSGSLAFDYLGGNNGTLQGNVVQGSPGPTNGFGASSTAYALDGASSYVDVPGAPVNLTGPMSLVQWVNGGGSSFETSAGKGDASYRFDVDGGGIAHFADGRGPDAVGGPKTGTTWHQLVGVFDGSTSNVYLYVDGLRVATQTAGAMPGSALDFFIGGAPDYTGRFFIGSVAQVAMFNYPLSAAQVQSLFNAAATPPYIVTNPTNFAGNAGGSVTFRAVANGAPPLSYQWTGPGGPIAGATNTTLTLTGLNQNGTPPNGGPGDYFVTVTNLSGSVDSLHATLSVISSSPFFVQDLPATSYGIVGSPATLSVDVGGNEPLTNRWYFGSTALHDGDRGGRISGATNLTLTIANAQTNDNGSYQIFVTNGVAPFWASSSVGQLVIENEPHFNGDGSGWTLNGGASITSDVLTLTDGANGETRSVWFNTPMYIGAFKASFTYQATPGTSGASLADGATFCLQNSAAGLTALGGGGGSLGYAGIENSAALAVDLYNARGYQFVTGGANPGATGNYVVTAPTVDTGSGHPIQVNLVYNGNTIALSLTDTTTQGSFSTNLQVGALSSIVGTNTALIGFTGATGGANSTQTISAFSFVPTPVVSVAHNGTGVTLSWPTGVGGYVLQKNSSLTNAAGWTAVNGPYTVVGENYQVTVTPATGLQFYRLVVAP